MQTLRLRCALLSLGVFAAPRAEAQWADPHLIAGQVGFGVASSFLGKLILGHRPPGRALREAVVEGSASGLVAHAGYSIAGRNPRLALVGKTLAQKSNLMTHRSMTGKPVFDRSLVTHWQLTHSFLHFRLEGKPRLAIDVINLAVSGYYLLSDGFQLDGRRSLSSGSLVFRNHHHQESVKGLSAPGVLWMASAHYEDPQVLGHELVHSLQMERGAAIGDWHYRGLRLNLLAFASGVPAALAGWPEHNRRWHEREADLYAGRK